MKKLLSLLIAVLMFFSLVPMAKAVSGDYPYSGTVSRTVALGATQPATFWLGPSIFVNSKGDIIMVTQPDKDQKVQIATLDMSTGNTTKIADIGQVSPQPGIYPSPDGKDIYIHTWDSTNNVPQLIYFSLEDEKVVWTKLLGGFIASGSQPDRMYYNNIIPLSQGLVVGISSYNAHGRLTMYDVKDGSVKWEIVSKDNPSPGNTIYYNKIYPLPASNDQHVYAVEYVEVIENNSHQGYQRFLDIDPATGNIKSTTFKKYQDIISSDNSKTPDLTKPIIYDTHYYWDADKKQGQEILCWISFDDNLEYQIATLPLSYYFDSNDKAYYTDAYYYQIGNVFFAMDNSSTFQDQSIIAYNPTFLWKIDANKATDSKGNVVPADLRYSFKDNAFYYVNKNILNAVDIKTGNPILNVDLGSDMLNGGVIGLGNDSIYALATKTDGKVYLYEATTKLNTFTLTATSGTNGTITPAGTTTINYGISQTFAITPNTGYKIKDVLVDGISIGAVSTYTFTNVTANHTIEAVFEINSYTIRATAGVGGSITPSGLITVNYGGSQAFEIYPDKGYLIKDVLTDGISIRIGQQNPPPLTSAGFSFKNITANHTIEAIFEKETIIIILKIGSKSFTVNGVSNTLDSPPVIKNGRTLLPIRAVIEALNGSVGWDAATKKVTVSLGSNTIELWIGRSNAKVNGIDTPIDSTNSKVVPEIINGRTMLPLRFVTENLGCGVQWDGTIKTITITYSG
jgi:hypothetical protein